MTELVESVAKVLIRSRLMLATAESCTGGWLAKVLTGIPGSSQWFECGYITYSNNSKQKMVGVDPATLEAHGAVSKAVVIEMVEGLLHKSGAQIGVAISGIAGPEGGSKKKPVGMVCFAWKKEGALATSQIMYFEGNRTEVRSQAVNYALQGILDVVNSAKVYEKLM